MQFSILALEVLLFGFDGREVWSALDNAVLVRDDAALLSYRPFEAHDELRYFI